MLKSLFSSTGVIGFSACLFIAYHSPVWAKGEVTQIHTHQETTTSTNYTVNGTNYTWQGDNLVIDALVYNGTTYDYTVMADQVVIRRAGNSVTTGDRCALFAAYNGSSTTMKPDYPRLNGTDNCDMAAVMGGNVINRGVLDLFNNGGGGRTFSAKNIERVDFIFSGGVTTPIDAAELTQTGVVATEKSGNNDVLVAAILSLDANGNPASYSLPVRIYRNWEGAANKYAYGMTGVPASLVFVSNELNPPQGYPEKHQTSYEDLGMVFVDMQGLGLSAGQTWYGFSYFSPDIANNSPNALGQVSWNAGIDPVDYTTFPQNTDHSYDYGDADVYGGVGGYFVKSTLNNIAGFAYQDTNQNSQYDNGETGIPQINVKLYKDNDGNGEINGSDAELASVDTDSLGAYAFSGLSNGNYIIVLDDNDTDIPVTQQLNTSPTLSLSVNNQNINDANFPFISQAEDGKLALTKTVSPNRGVLSGETVVYTINVNNTSSDTDATGVVVTDKLSNAVTYVSDTGNGDYDPATGLWQVGTVNASQEKILTITVTVN
ncbi:MAG: SdrD B-like domain-containing protein [bacterium]